MNLFVCFLLIVCIVRGNGIENYVCNANGRFLASELSKVLINHLPVLKEPEAFITMPSVNGVELGLSTLEGIIDLILGSDKWRNTKDKHCMQVGATSIEALISSINANFEPDLIHNLNVGSVSFGTITISHPYAPFFAQCRTYVAKEYDRRFLLNIGLSITKDAKLRASVPNQVFSSLYEQYMYAHFLVPVDETSRFVDYATRTKSTTVWTQLHLSKSATKQLACVDDSPDYNNCRNLLYDLPEVLFSEPLKMSKKTFLLSNTEGERELYPELEFSLTDKQYDSVRNKINSNSMQKGKLVPFGGGFGIEMRGCSVPVLVIRVEWSGSVQEKSGGIFAAEKSRYDVPNVRQRRRRRRTLLEYDGFDEELSIFHDYNHSNNDMDHRIRSKQRRILLQSSSSVPSTMSCMKRTIRVIDIVEEAASNTSNYVSGRMKCRMATDINQVKYYLQSGGVDLNVAFKDSAFAERLDNKFIKVPYSVSYIEQIKKCASYEVGMYWKGTTDETPGFCVECPSSSRDVSVARRNILSRYCNLQNILDVNKVCCYGCKPGYIQTDSSVQEERPRCVKACSMGYFFTGEKCMACEANKYSKGGSVRVCGSCYDIGMFNALYLKGRGCVSCGSRAFADVQKRICEPCPQNKYVANGTDYCTFCSPGEYLPRDGGECLPCPPGTKGNNYGVCEMCPVNYVSPNGRNTGCTACENGKMSNLNRTMCHSCPALPNNNLAEYYQVGCDYVRCIPSKAYAVGNPYHSDGCRSCSELVGVGQQQIMMIGTYRNPNDCSEYLPCQNVKPSNSMYSSAAVFGSTECEWSCNPGYQKVIGSSTCISCSHSSSPIFNASLHEYTEGCTFNCKPFKYRDAAKICSVDCVDLLVEYARGNIMERVRDYADFQGQRPNYVQGVCGADDAKVPYHLIPFLWQGRYAALLWTGSDFCGNSLLNDGEECDDGNKVGGDGCSSNCKVERNRYWDCDVIGKPCALDCGWPLHATEDWGLGLYGYKFHECPQGVCSCTGKLYYDIVRMAVGTRKSWMSLNLISCDCDRNEFRRIDYEHCTPLNRGCRECPSGQYYHDLRRECVFCGKHCLPGYEAMKGDWMLTDCRNDTSYRYSQIFNQFSSAMDIEREQRMIGCTRCNADGHIPEFIDWLPNNYTHSCMYKCHRDSTGLNPQNDSYCPGVNPDSVSGSCPIQCVSCETKRSQLEQSSGGAFIGKYIKGCIDNTGYEWVDCDSSILPLNAKFTSRSEIIGDKKGCKWECLNSSFYLEENLNLCLLKFSFTPDIVTTKSPCSSSSEYVKTVSTGLNNKVCLPCDSWSLPTSYQVWRSRAPYFDTCYPECEAGVAWSSEQSSSQSTNDTWTCRLCSTFVECELGEKYWPCTVNKDAYCESCGVLGANMEFIEAGNCDKRQCISGYYYTSQNGGVCVSCNSVSCGSGSGLRVSTSCELPENRLTVPQCITCPIPLGNHEKWDSNSKECDIVCDVGYIRWPRNFSTVKNQTDLRDVECVSCTTDRCHYGYFGQCYDNINEYSGVSESTSLNCYSCVDSYGALPSGTMYNGNGTCAYKCIDNDYVVENGICVVKSLIQSPENGVVDSSKTLTPEEEEETQTAIYLHLNGHPVRLFDHSD